VITRLGLRVSDPELAFARLEPVLALGAEEREVDGLVEFAVYGEAVPSDEELRALAGETLVAITREPVPDGWERAWHDHLERVVVGSIAVRPPWIAGREDDIVIEPGLSFGAAAHPTTRLCLGLLQELPPTPLADWGCGSGVLAIAAARLGFAPVVGIELDPAAASVARSNARTNDVSVEVRVGDVTREPVWEPTVVANLTLPLLTSVESHHQGVCNSTLVASGVLSGQADLAVAAWARHGLAERERRELDGWTAFVLERP
jgi:ribosomal protein L11 methyltransferase